MVVLRSLIHRCFLFCRTFLAVSMLSFTSLSVLAASSACDLLSLPNCVVDDAIAHYQPKRLWHLSYWTAANALLSYSEADRPVRTYWQHHLRSDFSDDLSEVAEKIGGVNQLTVMLPLYATALSLPQIHPECQACQMVGHWGGASLRMSLLMAPQQVVLTNALGARRPPHSPKWRPFKGNGRSASGHASYGAIPFFALAASTENRWIKGTAIGLSALPALSRLNDDKHYLSQVVLGWGISWMAYQTITRSDDLTTTDYSMRVEPLKDGARLSFHYGF